MFWIGNLFSDCVYIEIGGVGGKDGVFVNYICQLGEYFVFDFDVFEDGFDDDIVV